MMQIPSPKFALKDVVKVNKDNTEYNAHISRVYYDFASNEIRYKVVIHVDGMSDFSWDVAESQVEDMPVTIKFAAMYESVETADTMIVLKDGRVFRSYGSIPVKDLKINKPVTVGTNTYLYKEELRSVVKNDKHT